MHLHMMSRAQPSNLKGLAVVLVMTLRLKHALTRMLEFAFSTSELTSHQRVVQLFSSNSSRLIRRQGSTFFVPGRPKCESMRLACFLSFIFAPMFRFIALADGRRTVVFAGACMIASAACITQSIFGGFSFIESGLRQNFVTFRASFHNFSLKDTAQPGVSHLSTVRDVRRAVMGKLIKNHTTVDAMIIP